MNAPTMLRVARDEWPAVVWFSAMPGPNADVRGWLAEDVRVVRRDGRMYLRPDGSSVYILAQRGPSSTWEASVVYVLDGARYWRPRGLHPTLRAALRDLRAHLAWDLAGAIQAATLIPESADWSAVDRLAAVARRWA